MQNDWLILIWAAYCLLISYWREIAIAALLVAVVVVLINKKGKKNDSTRMDKRKT